MVISDPTRPGVPAPIAVVREFVNTTDHETGSDDISTPEELGRYLRSSALWSGSGRATVVDLQRAHDLRAGLRGALELNHEGGSTSLPVLAAALRELSVGLDWTEQAVALRVTEVGVRGALARIGLAAHTCCVDGAWGRLKICASDQCEWAYFDHSKNRSRNWCEYGCGNKIKTRAYRARQRSVSSG